MSPAWSVRVRLAGVLVGAVILQTTVVPDLRILGVCPDLMLLCTVCAALVGGPELGTTVGFAAGLLADLFVSTTPLGLTALAFTLVGYSVGSIRRTVLQEGWVLAPAAGFVASAAGVIIFVLAGVMVGQSQLTRVGPLAIVRTALLVGVMNAVIALPMSRLVGWAASGSDRPRDSANELSSTAARRSSRLGDGAGAGAGRGSASWSR